jgi:hypothetical protein
MRRGQSTIPFTVIEAATTMLLILSLTYGTQVQTNSFVKEETLNLQVDRVTNAALALNSMPKGYLELKMAGYGMKYEDSEVTMNYSGKRVTSEINESMTNYNSITGPSEFTKVNGTLCMRKTTGRSLEISVGEC